MDLRKNVAPAVVKPPMPTGAPVSTSLSSTSTAKQAMGKTKEMFKKMWEEKGPVMIFILAVILVFVIVIIYITFALKNSNLKGKSLITKPVKLNELAVPVEVTGSDIPKPAVGREYAISFWLYIEQFEQTPGNNKLLFYRGSKDDISMANPIVMMDSSENKMYICIKTQDNSLNPAGMTIDGSSTLDLRNIVNKNYFKNQDLSGAETNKYIIMEIDYVPLQRWVNFTMIVDNKILTLFMDGEIYSVKTTDELKATRKPELDSNGVPIKYNLIVDKTEGNMYVGKNSINNKVTVNGYLSNLTFHNYAISINQVKSVYNQGPLALSGLGGLLNSFGIQYGLRSPVYKLSENVK